ncbi:MAG: hypothetical protein GX053_04805 [Tissierella sp.]|nr:hypothetical protein [Tissierella sp.]
MQNQSFKDIMKLEIDVTNKLLEYMHAKIDLINVLEELNLDYTFIQDERNNLAFNIWLSVDYIGKDGKTFIQKFLSDESSHLSKVERDILGEKSKSHVSLFEIMSFENGSVLLKDVLVNEEHKVLEPNINNVIQTGEFLFTRIGDVLNHKIFMGDINYVPSTVKDLFLEELLVDYNIARKDQGNITMVEYLKKHSLDLYKLYNESLINAIDAEGDINSYLFDELDEFEVFLLNRYKGMAVKKHISNLTNIFEYALADDDMTLYDIDQIEYHQFFVEAIEDGFITSQDELNSYITTIKYYLQYLSMADPYYKEFYSEILDVSKDRFKYMNIIDVNNSLDIDKNIASMVNFSLNDQSLDVLLDYDKFILYISDKDIKLTSATKHLKRKDLIQLNDLFEIYFPIDSKTPNQKDFPFINFYFYASLNVGAIEIKDDNLVLTNKGLSVLRLSDEEKYTLLLQYLFSKDFIKNGLYCSNDSIDIKWEGFMKNISDLNLNKQHQLDLYLKDFETLFNYHYYLEHFGLIKTQFRGDSTVNITSLGKKVFNYLVQKSNEVHNTDIIKLEDFKKQKINVEG